LGLPVWPDLWFDALWLSSVATAQRGYHAIGGEALILVFPLLAYWVWDSIKTFLKGVKSDEEMF
jgi:hypothetical protein